jgi:hypothetical protein
VGVSASVALVQPLTSTFLSAERFDSTNADTGGAIIKNKTN